MSTAKSSHLPANITVEDQAKQFCATAISPIQVACKLRPKF